MANRFPLIINTSANQIQEIAAGDNLDLTSSSIVGINSVTASSFYGDGSTLSNIPTGAGFGTAVSGYSGAFSYYNDEYNLNANLTLDSANIGSQSTRIWTIYQSIIVQSPYSLTVGSGYSLIINPANC